jgi:hypothetical protein
MGMIIPAAIGGAAQLGGAALGGKAANKAAKAQAASQDKSLAFAREQEAAAQGRYGQSKAQYDKQVADWYAARNALLGRYGVDINLGSGGMPAGGSGGAPAPSGGASMGPAMAQGPARSPYQGATLGDIVQSKNPQEMTDWWSAAGLGPKGA